jgi:predicted nucleic acid-binding protein
MTPPARGVLDTTVFIAATAASRDLPVVTQDNDFDPLDGIAGLAVVRM